MVSIALFMSEREPDVTVRREKKIFSLKTGEQIDTQRRVFATFRRGGIPDWAMPLALERFPMSGKPDDLPAHMFLCTYDSAADQQVHGWSDEEREMIEATLRAKPGVVEISLPRIPAPWPKYPEIVVHGRRTIEKVVEQVLAGIETTGVDPDAVLRFERQELNRPEVIEAVEGLIRDRESAVPEETVVAA